MNKSPGDPSRTPHPFIICFAPSQVQNTSFVNHLMYFVIMYFALIYFAIVSMFSLSFDPHNRQRSLINLSKFIKSAKFIKFISLCRRLDQFVVSTFVRVIISLILRHDVKVAIAYCNVIARCIR